MLLRSHLRKILSPALNRNLSCSGARAQNDKIKNITEDETEISTVDQRKFIDKHGNELTLDDLTDEQIQVQNWYNNSVRGPDELDRDYVNRMKECGKTADKPIIVQSKQNKAIVGCVCEGDDGANVRWFYLNDGPGHCL